MAQGVANIFPNLQVEIKTISTRGDENQDRRLDEIFGEGVFVKELEQALLRREIDIAVHSLKDMPTTLPDRLALAGVLERSDPQDVLVTTSGAKLADLPAGARIATGSLRRAAQLKAKRPDLKTDNIRGNLETRLNKVYEGNFDGIILAAAGMLRLGLGDKITEYLPTEDFLPTVGQGAIGLEIFKDDTDSAEIVSKINHLPTWYAVRAERAFLRRLGGGCRSPIAALGTVNDSEINLCGMVMDISGKHAIRVCQKGSTSNPEELGERLAQEALRLGAGKLISR